MNVGDEEDVTGAAFGEVVMKEHRSQWTLLSVTLPEWGSWEDLGTKMIVPEPLSWVTEDENDFPKPLIQEKRWMPRVQVQM
jgi:hypothetical protein